MLCKEGGSYKEEGEKDERKKNNNYRIRVDIMHIMPDGHGM